MLCTGVSVAGVIWYDQRQAAREREKLAERWRQDAAEIATRAADMHGWDMDRKIEKAIDLHDRLARLDELR